MTSIEDEIAPYIVSSSDQLILHVSCYDCAISRSQKLMPTERTLE